uniref:EF-hand domain-containing protein n=1 Tax=Cryptomonas curvata TaxID=233186 RepID=A0A7S0MH87_9CRYP|mmetsp:Transcript_39914/g.83529  ORF Transcript_39914/g.83529 Transcript_39914/m.83529 type:complete len:111 (+) Transcript_39914:3-335(+)
MRAPAAGEPALRGALSSLARLPDEEVEAFFKLHDINHSGTIDASELLPMFNEMGLKAKEEEIANWMRQAHVDGDNQLDLVAFRKLLGRPQPAPPSPQTGPADATACGAAS